MVLVKSFSVGEGDMFYIKHSSDNFTIIDCYLSDENKEVIVEEIKREAKGKGITRFISTHPDEDHICGLKFLDDQTSILNFYCVKNEATKSDATIDFDRCCQLRDSKKAFYLYKDCSRKWMNIADEERGSSGISILWPILNDEDFLEELKSAKDGNSPNNISPIIRYHLHDGASMMWMGDLEKDFLDKIKDKLSLPQTDILFAPHHGRGSGKVPENLLNEIRPKIIIIGEAPAGELNYYANFNSITQNTAGNILFKCEGNKVHIYVSNKGYSVNYLSYDALQANAYYIGTLTI